MTANINAKTGIAFGYISADALDPDVVDDLLYGSGAVNLTFAAQLKDFIADQRAAHEDSPPDSPYDERGEFDEGGATEGFGDTYQGDEDTIEGEIDCLGYGPVKYCSSYLGGALNFFILESPFSTDKARRASPCVPNAAILDTLDGNVTGYDVPADWRRNAD